MQEGDQDMMALIMKQAIVPRHVNSTPIDPGC